MTPAKKKPTATKAPKKTKSASSAKPPSKKTAPATTSAKPAPKGREGFASSPKRRAAPQPSKKVSIPIKTAPAVPVVPPSPPPPPPVAQTTPIIRATPKISPPEPLQKVSPKLKVSTQVTVRELSEKIGIKVNDFIKKLISMGVFATINQRLDSDTAILVAHEYGFDLEVVPLFQDKELISTQVQDKPEQLKPRPPVVTIMGHVDHGKTSLLDAIRETKVAEKEAGGITQHIGAYKVSTHKGEIVFLDTPGHEAFTAMRARGAKATDIVVLVVSAADGVMPQTVEAIDHAKAAEVPIVVAINKIDLPTANVQKIKQELSQYNLMAEDWGGKTIMVEVSAKKRLHLDKLLEMILLEAELLEIKANPDRPGVGVILEARMDSKKGNLATLLVQNGTVKVGDSFIAGLSYGRIRALTTDHGERVSSALPSTPIEIIGISGATPQAGDIFNVVSSETQAKEIAEKRRLIHREETLAHQKHISLLAVKSKGVKELKIILKADVQGSIQAIKDSLEKLATSEISVKVIHAGIGNINESDILLAKASDAVILGFHVTTEERAREEADRSGVEIRAYSIIYDLLSDVKAAMEGLLEPEIVETVTGRLEVRQVFQMKGGKIAGCFVLEGKIQRGSPVRILRGGKTISQGKVASLKRFKDDVKEVEKNLECGLTLEGFQDYAPGDVLEVVTKEKKTRRLQAA
ncbi:MAG: translation initiation factor IF-2 [Elusimicrobia bacterium]|nr:translation initiation factor IF-2 [Elusimicrobiota bacterium]